MIKIVIVGGGAGGMELVTRLGKKLGKKEKAEVTLVDTNDRHVWKPLLSEWSIGTLGGSLNAIEYRNHGEKNGFNFAQGRLRAIDRIRRHIVLAPVYDAQGLLIFPEREIKYDYLVIGVGAVAKNFDIPGVEEHCEYLDNTEQATALRQKLSSRLLKYAQSESKEQFGITIVGAGAPGVELAAEMHHAANFLSNYGYKDCHKMLKITLVEARSHVLPRILEPRIFNSVVEQLVKLGVDVQTNTVITEITKAGMVTEEDGLISSDLIVWTAGVQAPPFLSGLGLETNQSNQILVDPECRSLSDDRIFAFGDCAASRQTGDIKILPCAEAARRMARIAGDNIQSLIRDSEAYLKKYTYENQGSLVSLSRTTPVGKILTFVDGGVPIESKASRVIYTSLYSRHMITLHGPFKGLFLIGFNSMQRLMHPELKLH